MIYEMLDAIELMPSSSKDVHKAPKIMWMFIFKWAAKKYRQLMHQLLLLVVWNGIAGANHVVFING